MLDAMAAHCCIELRSHVQVTIDGVVSAVDRAVAYDPVFDEYFLIEAPASPPVVLAFCPWCGRRLPASKRERWYDELDHQGLDPDDPLPSRYRSDAWWRRPLP